MFQQHRADARPAGSDRASVLLRLHRGWPSLELVGATAAGPVSAGELLTESLAGCSTRITAGSLELLQAAQEGPAAAELVALLRRRPSAGGLGFQ